jgi:hypothetical protein
MAQLIESAFLDQRALEGVNAFPGYLRDTDGQPISRQAVERQLCRVVESHIFTRSKQLCRFLRFVVEETLHGHAEAVKESLIGTMVFQRGELFNPGIDPIVRVQARRLRSKLDEYYRTQGQDDPLVIRLRAGSYSPLFESRAKGRAVPLREAASSPAAALAEIHQSIAACERLLNINREGSRVQYNSTGADATHAALDGDDPTATMARVNEILLRVLDLTRRVAEAPAVCVAASEAWIEEKSEKASEPKRPIPASPAVGPLHF